MKKMFMIIACISFLTITLFAKESKFLIVDELEVYLEKNIVLIDIRDENSWKKTGIIPNSYRLTYPNNNESKWLSILIRLIRDKNRAFVLISKDGSKAKELASKLYNEKKLKNAMYLDGGIAEWIASDRKVTNY